MALVDEGIPGRQLVILDKLSGCANLFVVAVVIACSQRCDIAICYSEKTDAD